LLVRKFRRVELPRSVRRSVGKRLAGAAHRDTEPFLMGAGGLPRARHPECFGHRFIHETPTNFSRRHGEMSLDIGSTRL